MYVLGHDFKDFKQQNDDFNKMQDVKLSAKEKEIGAFELKI